MLARPDAVPAAVARRRWGDLRLRVFSALLLVAVGLAALFLGGVVWRALVGAAAAGLAIEWWALCRRLRDPARLGVAMAGVPYVGCAAIALIWLRDTPGGCHAVLLLLLVVWASDIGAYLAGRTFGGPLLAPGISPGKTWAGAAGGLLAAMLAGLAVAGPHGTALVCAATLGISAQVGDLLESAIKRGFGVKDSGTLIPGHGGLFDRLDGLLTASPVAALLAASGGHAVMFAS